MTSPFDRKPQSPYASGQAPSFKTNVNRAKTKKWVEAKAYSYEGDDWGDYDEADEYGVEPSPPAQGPTGLRQRGQTTEQQAAGARSFTNPVGMPSQALHRSNSFEQGDERRTFSAGTHPPQGYGDFPQGAPQQAEYNQQPRGPSGAPLHVQTDMPPRQRGDSVATSSSRYPSATQSTASEVASSGDPTRRRDFSPSAMPAPLQSRTPLSGAPQSAIDTGAQFTPRKSNQPGTPTATVSGPETTGPTDFPPRQQTPSSSAKPLPFIRPADIYKRMEEERARERASQESSRPSMDSILKPREEAASPTPPRERSSMENLPRRTSLENVNEQGRSSTPSQQRGTPLATVAERKSEYGLPALSQDQEKTPTAAEHSTQLPTATNSGPPILPQFAQTSDFGSGFWGDGSGPSAEQPLGQSSMQVDTGLQHQPSLGFRSVVQQAFDRPDESKSVPATPSNFSNQGSLRSPAISGSDISRSNTDSTAGISPIMSRMPSVGASSAAKGNNNQLQPMDLSSTPSIAEEANESSRPPSRSIPRKPSPSHSREPSAGSVNYIPGYRRDLNTPPPRGSPARSPVIEAQKEVVDPKAAEITVEGPEPTPTNNMATRESDLTSSINTAMSTKELTDAERRHQTEFVESHRDIAAPTAETLAGRLESPAKGRSQSPSKNRVQELAGRFDDIAEANSRRNSSHSIDSRNSWKQGAETIDHLSQRPPIEQQPSFRPKLPGQWESFATSRGTSTPNESDAEPDFESQKDTAQHPVGQEAVSPEKDPIAEEVDLTPTTSTHPLPARDTQGQYPSLTKDPMAALAAAGTDIGEALTSSLSPTSPDQPESPENTTVAEYGRDAPETRDSPAPKRDFGNIYSRPPAPDRLESDVSSIPPSPPPKDAEELAVAAHDAEESDDDLPPPPVPLKSSRNPSGEHSFSESTRATPPPRPAITTQLSPDTAFDDEEHDRLRQDIVRTLSPIKDSEENQHGSLDAAGLGSSQRDSSVLPAEYDTYWEGARDDGSRYSQMLGETQVGPQGVEMTGARPKNIPEEAWLASPETARPNLLDQRFSWEKKQDANNFADFVGAGDTGAATTAGATADGSHGNRSGHSSPAIAARDLLQRSEEIPASVSPIAKDTPERNASPPTYGLHVINATGQEEAVDMPPRLTTPNLEDHPAAKSEVSLRTEPRSIDEKASSPGPLPDSAMQASSQTKQRLLPFREIAAIPNPQERIRSFNATREQFATMDTGLRGWLATTMGAHPEHNNLISSQLPPIMTSSPPAPQFRPGHKASPSLSKFTNLLSPTSPQHSQTFDNPSTMQGSSPSSGLSTSGAGQKLTGSGVGTKMGKDLLNSAGALGGKATTGAKGLFAKGRSRFRSSTGGDKATPTTTSSASSQHERNSSHSPSQLPEDTPTRRKVSPFRRFSRPSSMAVSEGESIPEMPLDLLPISPQGTPDSRLTDDAGISQPKRRLSPFRRFSRPSSTFNPADAEGIPEVPKDPLPLHQRSVTMPMPRSEDDPSHAKAKAPEKDGKVKQISSLFRRRSSRLGPSAVSSDEQSIAQGLSSSATYNKDRRASYAFGTPIDVPMPPAINLDRRASYTSGQIPPLLPPAPDIFGDPADKLREGLGSRLGVLPTPTKEAFGNPDAFRFLKGGGSGLKQGETQEDIDRDFNAVINQDPQSSETAPSNHEGQEEEDKHSRLIASIVRHASPPLQAIESRRQSRAYEPGELQLPSMAQVSGAPTPTPSSEKNNQLVAPAPPSVASEGPKTDVSENEEVQGSSAKPVLGATPPTPVVLEPPEGVDSANLGVADDRPATAVSWLEEDEDSTDDENGGATQGVQRGLSGSSRPDVSPISEEYHEGKDALAQAVAYGARKSAWLDISDEEEEAVAAGAKEEHDEKSKPVEPHEDEPLPGIEKEAEMLTPTRVSTSDEWEQVSREVADETEYKNKDESEEEDNNDFKTPAEERNIEFDDDDSLYGDAAPKRPSYVSETKPQIHPAGFGAEQESEGIEEVESIRTGQGPQEQTARTVLLTRPVVHERDVDDSRPAVEERQKSQPPPVPPKDMPPRSQGAFGSPSTSSIKLQPSAEGLLGPSFPIDRPMSFTPLPRDSCGQPIQEQINQSEPQVEEETIELVQQSDSIQSSPERPLAPQLADRQEVLQEQSESPRQRSDTVGTTTSKGSSLRRASREYGVAPPPPRFHGASKRSSMQAQSPQMETPPESALSQRLLGIGEQGFSLQVIDPRQHTGAEYQLPGVGPPDDSLSSSERPSRTGLRKPSSRGSTSKVETPPDTRINPQLVAPPNERGLSYQSTSTAPDVPNEERRGRKPGLWGAFSRPTTAGAASVMTTNSTAAQPSTSPTRIHYLSQLEREREQREQREQEEHKGGSFLQKKASKKLGRANTSAEDGSKKKRFGALGSIFGRSGTTGHGSSAKASKPNKASGSSSPSPVRPMQSPAPQPPTSHTFSIHTWRGLRASRSTAQHDQQTYGGPQLASPPPAGYYAPEEFGQSNPVNYGQWQTSDPNLQQQSILYNNGVINPVSPPSGRWTRPDHPQSLSYGPPPARHLSLGSAVASPTQNSFPYSPPVRHNSSPASPNIWNRRPHAPRMPSIGEDGRHQERPWAITLPEGPESDDPNRRDSIQYAMMIRQQMQEQIAAQQQQQPHQQPSLPPQGYEQGADYYRGHRQNQPPPAMIQHRPSQHGQPPRFYLDPAAIARQKFEEQDQARARQRMLEQARMQSPGEDGPLSPESSLSPRQQPKAYSHPSPQRNIVQPKPEHPQQVAYDHYAQQPFPGHEAQSAINPSSYPLPMSPEGTTSPIDPTAAQLPPPPPPKIALPQPPMRAEPHAQQHPSHQRYPSSTPPAYDQSELQQQTQARGHERTMSEEEEPVVMHAASYPGMEWAPRWDEY